MATTDGAAKLSTVERVVKSKLAQLSWTVVVSGRQSVKVWQVD